MPAIHYTTLQTDARVGSIEVKIKKLDGELARYKDQMSKLKNGPGKVRRPHPPTAARADA